MSHEGYPEISDYVNYRDYFVQYVHGENGGPPTISGDELTGCCPFHADEKQSFGVDLKTSRWKCFAGCGSGNITNFHARIKGTDTREAYKDLCALYGIPRNYGNGDGQAARKPGREPRGEGARCQAAPPAPKADHFISEDAWADFTPFDEPWFQHFEQARGWKRETINSLGLRKSTHYFFKDKIRKCRTVERVAIPIRDTSGILRNIRSYHPKPPEKQQKILSWAKGFGGARNFPAVPIETGTVYLCEGEPDTICAISMGLNAITHTTKPTEYPEFLAEPFAGRDVVVCYDADKPGQHYALISAKNLLKVAKSVKLLEWPDYMGRQPDGQWPDDRGEDLTDFFVKHGKGLEDFHALPMKDYLPPKDGVKELSPSAVKAIAVLDLKHAVTMAGGRCFILNEDMDPVTGQNEISLSSISDFKNRYSNWSIETPVIGGNTKKEQATSLWLSSPDRRQFDGIVFTPGKTTPGFYNLWKGLPIQPREGDWSLFKTFIFDVVCNRVESIFHYVLAWVSRIVQDPGGERPGTAIVLRGKQGTGKGTFANWIGRMFGVHFMAIAHCLQILGRFNSHLGNKIVVFIDEGFWAGDKQAEGVLKSMITEPFINLEQKGKDVIRLSNHLNLLIASNSSWVIPAGLEERRFLVLDVSDAHQQDHQYFNAIHEQMQAGGLEAMLYDLLQYDRSGTNLRQIPRTSGLFEQILSSMNMVRKFWFQKLKDGELESWPSWVKSDVFFLEYLNFCERHKERFPLIQSQFYTELRKVCRGVESDRRRAGEGGRHSGWRIPSLEECRNEFNALVKMPVNWDDEAQENQEEVPF